MENRDGFTGKFGIVAAAAGSAIGLGNIWRFPYVLGENGGAAFLLIYLALILGLGVPVMLSEMLIGRRGQRNIFGSFRRLAPGSLWPGVGLLGVATAFVILSFYSVVAGWTVDYVFLALKNEFAGKSPEEIKLIYDAVSGDAAGSVILMIIFMAACAYIVLSGIKNGIEKYAKILMPLLLVIIILLCIRAVTLDGASAGLSFLFTPDFSKINAAVILEALGQAFFSLSLGMGAMLTYGSYISKRDSLAQTAISVSLSDTLIAILAGVAIFPAVFAFGIQPDAGPGLVFVTLPGIFNQMAGGYFFSILFFTLLVIAALTSAISLLEVIVAYFTEELKLKRVFGTWLASGLVAALGVLCSVEASVFDFFDKTSSNILLPAGGLLIVLFTGWVLGKKNIREELEEGGNRVRFFTPFIVIVKFAAPVAIAAVFLNSTGLIKF